MYMMRRIRIDFEKLSFELILQIMQILLYLVSVYVSPKLGY